MNILVCGGAGYIGSHAVMELLEKGYSVIVADSFEKGHRQAVAAEAEILAGDLKNEGFVSSIFKKRKIDAVIDFAAYSLVGESVGSPLEYYYNNVYGTMNLLKAMKENEVKHIVFSSTAAVYGEPESVPILETNPQSPGNPYGETKLAVEKMLKWADSAYGINYCALRYFNVAGAHPSGKIGEDHRPETHLIPNILKAALGEGGPLYLFGDDYPTPDGTCIRDYIHVTDLAAAHILALEKIMETGESRIYNLGNGKGFSNKEIIDAACEITGKKINYTVAERRPGDPSILVASSEKIMKELGFKPKYGSLRQIIESAFKWHLSRPNGYDY